MVKKGEGRAERQRSVKNAEGLHYGHLHTSVSPRGRLCDGRPEGVMAVVVVAAAAAAAIRCGACCDGCSLVAPPFSPVKIIRGQGERGSDGTIEQWNDGSGSRVANERERTSETRKLKISTDKINTHQPPALGYRRRRPMPCLKRPLPLWTLRPFHHDIRQQSHRP